MTKQTPFSKHSHHSTNPAETNKHITNYPGRKENAQRGENNTGTRHTDPTLRHKNHSPTTTNTQPGKERQRQHTPQCPGVTQGHTVQKDKDNRRVHAAITRNKNIQKTITSTRKPPNPNISVTKPNGTITSDSNNCCEMFFQHHARLGRYTRQNNSPRNTTNTFSPHHTSYHAH